MRRSLLLVPLLMLGCTLASTDVSPDIDWKVEATFVPGVERLSISFARLPVSYIKPWLSAATAVADGPLSGEWRSASDDACDLKFVQRLEAAYVYDIQRAACEGFEPAVFTGTLHRIDRQLCLVVVDLWAGYMPAYGLFKIEIHDDEMRLFPLDLQSFESRVATANFEYQEGSITAPTAALESFVRLHVNDPTFFDEDPQYVYKK